MAGTFQQLMQQALALMQNPATWSQGMAMLQQLNSSRQNNASMAATITGYIAQIEANPESAPSIVMMASTTTGLPDSVKTAMSSILPVAASAASAKAAAEALGATAQDKSNYNSARTMLVMVCSQVMQSVQTAQPSHPTWPWQFGT